MNQAHHNSTYGDTSQPAIITVCVSEQFAAQLADALDQRSWSSANTSSFEAHLSSERRPALGALIKSGGGCLAYVGYDRDPAGAAETTEYLHGLLGSSVTVVAVAEELNPETMLLAMRAGCTEFLHQPISETALQETLERGSMQRYASMAKALPTGSILSFFGAKGGVGTTTLAVHLAMYLVQCHKKKTLLIDRHPELGHVCVYLGMDGSRCLFQEVVRNVSRLDSDLLHGFVAKHSSGLDVLSSPDICGGAKLMDQYAIARTLEFLRGEYDYVILDCGLPSDELNVPIVEASAIVYVVATPDVGAIRDLSRYVDALHPVENSMDRLQIVINRSSSTYAISIDQVEKAMKLSVSIRISSSYAELVRAGNLGEPIAPSADNELSRQFVRWAANLVGAAPAQAGTKKSKGLFGMFK